MRARVRAAIACARKTRREIAGDDGDEREEDQRDDVFGIGDREGVKRRQEKEIVGKRTRQCGDKRREQPVAARRSPARR